MIQVNSVKANAPTATFQPNRMTSAQKLKKPNLVARERGISNNNNRYTAAAVAQKTGLKNRFN